MYNDAHHFQSKVSSDRVELQSSTLPINVKGTEVSLVNENGNIDLIEPQLAINHDTQVIISAPSSTIQSDTVEISAIESIDLSTGDLTIQTTQTDIFGNVTCNGDLTVNNLQVGVIDIQNGTILQTNNNGTIYAGNLAGNSLTTANDNILIGNKAGSNVTTSNLNISLGTNSLRYGTGDRNIAIGYNSQQGANSVTTSSRNISLGSFSLNSVTTGGNNTVIGHSAGYNLTTGSGNTIIGYASTDGGEFSVDCVAIGSGSKAQGTNSIAVGTSAQSTKDNQVVLGHSNITETVLRGQVVLQSYATASIPRGVEGGVVIDSTTDEMKFFSGGLWKTNTIDTALALKADTTTLNTALALKADTTATDTALALKADQTDVDSLQTTTNTLQTNIDTEEPARSLADTTLQTNITAEASTRASVATTLTARLDNLTAPNYTTAQRNALTQASGLVVYNSTVKKLEMSDGTLWRTIVSQNKYDAIVTPHNLTSDTSDPNFIVSASSFTGSYRPYRLFDGIINNNFETSLGNFSNGFATNQETFEGFDGPWIKMELSNLKAISQYRIGNFDTRSPVQWRILTSTDDITYTVATDQLTDYVYTNGIRAYSDYISMPTTIVKYIVFQMLKTTHATDSRCIFSELDFDGVGSNGSVEVPGALDVGGNSSIAGNLLVGGVDILEEIKHLTKIRFPKTRLTADETALVFSTTANSGYEKHKAFDDQYKYSFDGGDSRSLGWMSNASFKENLTIDGSAVNGNYIYIDLNAHPTAVISSFQIYAPDFRFPEEYHLIGSNDTSSWTSLYYTASAPKKEVYPHGSYPGAYTYVNRIPNGTIYRYVGVQIIAGTDSGQWNGAIQELLLWGHE